MDCDDGEAQRKEQGRAGCEIRTAPWKDSRKDIAAQIKRIIVSHRTDHGRGEPAARMIAKDSTSGQFHKDTAYGIKEDGDTVVSRRPMSALSAKDIEIMTRGANIRDRDFQIHLARGSQSGG